MTIRDEFGRGAVIVVGNRLISIPIDGLLNIARELGGGRYHLDHLAHLQLQTLGRRIAQRIAMDAGQFR